jgi:hypothetical protein
MNKTSKLRSMIFLASVLWTVAASGQPTDISREEKMAEAVARIEQKMAADHALGKASKSDFDATRKDADEWAKKAMRAREKRLGLDRGPSSVRPSRSREYNSGPEMSGWRSDRGKKAKVRKALKRRGKN